MAQVYRALELCTGFLYNNYLGPLLETLFATMLSLHCLYQGFVSKLFRPMLATLPLLTHQNR